MTQIRDYTGRNLEKQPSVGPPPPPDYGDAGAKRHREPLDLSAGSVEDLGAKYKEMVGDTGIGKTIRSMSDGAVGRHIIKMRDEGKEKFKNVRLVESYGDIELGRMFENPVEDWKDVAKEQWEGLKSLFGSPLETGMGMQRMGAGIVDKLRSRDPKSEFPHLEPNYYLGGEEPPPRERIDPLKTPEHVGAGEEVEQALETARHRLSPMGIEENPLRGISDVADLLPWMAAKKIPAVSRTVGRLKGKADEAIPDWMPESTLRRTGKLAQWAVDPASATAGIPMAVTGKTVEVGAKAYNASKNWLEKRKLRGETGIVSETLSAVGGFTSGLGQKFIYNMKDRAQSMVERAGFGRNKGGAWGKKEPPKGPEKEKWIDVFREHRTGDLSDNIDSLLLRSFIAMDRWRDTLQDRYTARMARAFQDEDGNRAWIELESLKNIEDASGPLARILDDNGYEIKHAGIEGKKWKVVPKKLESPDKGFDPGDKAKVTELGSDREIIERQFERFLNQPSSMYMDEFHHQRLLLDDTIGSVSQGTSLAAGRMLSDLRKVIAEVAEEHSPEEYLPAMREYAREIRLMERADQELGLAPGRVNWRTDRVTGVERPDPEDLFDARKYGETIRRLSHTFSDNVQYGKQVKLLEEIQDLGDDHTIIPALMGIQSSPIAGSGLVVRSEISQIGRAVMAVGIGGQLGGLYALPAFALFSPRLITELIATSGDIARAPELYKATARIKKISEKAQKLNESTGGSLYAAALSSGLNLAQWLERVEQEAGVDLGADRPEGEIGVSEENQPYGASLEQYRDAGVSVRPRNEDVSDVGLGELIGMGPIRNQGMRGIPDSPGAAREYDELRGAINRRRPRS